MAVPPPAAVTTCDLYRYGQAYRLSEAIEAGLKTGRCQWRDRAGVLLETWGAVIEAILQDNVRVG